MNTDTIARLAALIRDADQINRWKWDLAPAPRDEQARRATSRKLTHNRIEWTDAGDEWTASLTVAFMPPFVSWHIDRDFRRNGRRTNLAAVKRSFARMRHEIQA